MLSNRDSNGYIVVFLIVLVLVVAVTLSLVNSGLKPIIDRNVMVDKKTQILKSVIIDPSQEFTADFVLSTYKEKVEELLIDGNGQLLEPEFEGEAFKTDMAKLLKLPEEERRYPLYKFNGADGSYFIMPLTGLGLWDKIWGYVAVESDFNTIRGAAFDHKGETPGLGARITEDWFRNQFQGDKFYAEDGTYALEVLKGMGNPQADASEYKVDGISGATLTANGVDAMLNKCVALYKPFFEKESN